MTQVLIDADRLAEAMLSDRPPVVLDVRWQLGDPDGYRHYRDGHVPGAVFVDLDEHLAAPPISEDGRHPLPDVGDLQVAARSWGIDDGVPVVVYDDAGGTAAARAWWLLRWGGLDDVMILDGALDGWRAAGFRLSSGDATPRAGTVTLTPGGLPTVTIDDVARGEVLLLDARAAERFRGEVEPVDPRPGRIPGAVSAPTGENLTGTGTFKTPDELRERFAGLGVQGDGAPVVVYCGSGITAAHQIAALAMAGIPAALFPGSYSQWSSDPERPIQTG
ncbi:sulfurtransferase [Gordonia caeni]|uniref:Sulfurtransferase n=1 Tax=Gordonia caeni TaxID=1007097 RepID=A0ABP7NUF3_9ACTN